MTHTATHGASHIVHKIASVALYAPEVGCTRAVNSDAVVLSGAWQTLISGIFHITNALITAQSRPTERALTLHGGITQSLLVRLSGDTVQLKGSHTPMDMLYDG